MPFISESITSAPVLRQTATALATHHVRIRPLSLPVVARTEPRHGVPMRTACMPAEYRNAAEAIRAAPVRPDDVWVLGYPGSGAAAVQLLVGRLLDAGRRAAADEGAADEDDEAAPLLEQTAIQPRLQRSVHQRPTWERVQRMPIDRPRVLRSHLPYLLLPAALWRQQPRIVYVTRAPADVAAEYYREYRLLHGYKGDRAEFAELWRAGLLAYGDHAAHVGDFVALEAAGVRNVHCVQCAVDTADAMRMLVERVAAVVEVDLDEADLAELVLWFGGVWAEERAFRAAVAVMDGQWKRAPTMDFAVQRVDGVE